MKTAGGEGEEEFSDPQSSAGFGAKVRQLPLVYTRVEVVESFPLGKFGVRVSD